MKLKRQPNGTYLKQGERFTLTIERNWQPVAGFPHKWIYRVIGNLSNKVETSGPADTLSWVQDATASYFK
jgi:hypothetical protein